MKHTLLIALIPLAAFGAYHVWLHVERWHADRLHDIQYSATKRALEDVGYHNPEWEYPPSGLQKWRDN